MTPPRPPLLRRVIERLGLNREWYFVVVAGGIGVIMGGVAMAFILPLRAIEHWAENADPNLLLWLVPLAPIAGAVLTGIVLKIMGGEGQPPGVSTVMYAIHRRKSRMELKIAGGKWIASTLTIGSGGSAGAEGPIVTIGSVIGSNIGRLLKTNPQNTATLLGCGAAAGIASVFNAPIAGIFFVLEVLLRDFSLRTFTPIVIAAVISSVLTQSVLGNDALFATREDFSVAAFTAHEIPNYLVLGVICGIGAALFIQALSFAERVFGSLKAPTILKPALGAAALGLLGFVYLQVIGVQRMPDFYGNGYPVIKTLLDPARYFEADGRTLGPVTGVLLMVAAIGLLKGIATCLTIGSGGSGGLFAPSLLIGASVGGTFGYIVNWLDWFPAATPAHYALVGMAAMTAANLHAPLTAILMVYEITQSYAIILPLMLAAVIATIVSRLIFSDSVYTVKLTRMGLRLGVLSDLTILRRMSVHDVPLAAAVVVHQGESAQRLLELSEQHLVRDFVVVDDQMRYVGMVTGNDLSAALVYREAIPLLQVQELQRSDLPTVTRDETLDVVLDKFAQHDTQSLAVLDDAGQGRVHGMITRARLMARYQAALSGD